MGLISLYFVGVAKKVDKVQDAIHDAFKLALNL